MECQFSTFLLHQPLASTILNKISTHCVLNVHQLYLQCYNLHASIQLIGTMSSNEDEPTPAMITQEIHKHSDADTKAYYDSTQTSDPRVIVAMTVGHASFACKDGSGWPDFDRGIWKDSNTPFVVTLEFLRNEVVHRAGLYYNSASIPAPKAWNRKKLEEWLIAHPIPTSFQQR